MTVMRDKHPPWYKRRALKYIDVGDLSNAVASMAFDLKKHPSTDNPALDGPLRIAMMYVTDANKAAVQRWIEAFDDRGSRLTRFGHLVVEF